MKLKQLKKRMNHGERHQMIYQMSRQIADSFLKAQQRGEIVSLNKCVNSFVTPELASLRAKIVEKALSTIDKWQASATAPTKAGEWVVMGGNEHGEGAFICTRCHEQCVPELPIDFEEFIAMGERFMERHRACPSQLSTLPEALP